MFIYSNSWFKMLYVQISEITILFSDCRLNLKYGLNRLGSDIEEIKRKGRSKRLSFERDNTCLCIPIGCNSVRTFVLANRNTETTLAPLKRQSFIALFTLFSSTICQVYKITTN